nr:PREDICTED: nuclear receptor-interacting protein 3 [Latimeria chalumnae]|eukprot:XP_005989735.1 PREDICTED: nuclear receptor-interacting protein 3 [Latimeria chalumnae]
MFYSGILTESTGKEMMIREAASIRQQRRMKQAVQFIHKDSADLLPLDGLKKLGTSKETQPHNILQRRLLENNLSKFRSGNCGALMLNNEILTQSNGNNLTKSEFSRRGEEEDMILVCCKCAGQEIKVAIDIGCRYNLISSTCLDKLGLKEHMKTGKNEADNITLPYNLKVTGLIEHLVFTIGQMNLECSAVVVEDDHRPFSFGLQTLRSLKCVIDLEKHHLVLGKAERQEIPFVDNNRAMNEDNSPEM